MVPSVSPHRLWVKPLAVVKAEDLHLVTGNGGTVMRITLEPGRRGLGATHGRTWRYRNSRDGSVIAHLSGKTRPAWGHEDTM